MYLSESITLRYAFCMHRCLAYFKGYINVEHSHFYFLLPAWAPHFTVDRLQLLPALEIDGKLMQILLSLIDSHIVHVMADGRWQTATKELGKVQMKQLWRQKFTLKAIWPILKPLRIMRHAKKCYLKIVYSLFYYCYFVVCECASIWTLVYFLFNVYFQL